MVYELSKWKGIAKYTFLPDRLIEKAIIFGVGPYSCRRLNELV
ncbi:MAG TPA: hypothetical protein PLP30_04085 [Clostridia bacterium]|jgi:hypothetical protein|nr:hypothetical protein [Clostridia bacterium]HPQ46524.1 hypothetical protein [Clostridia bacterium]HRX42115.1 hypothetical protein [Clostridia bacterium]